MINFHKNMSLKDAIKAAELLDIPIRHGKGSELCFLLPTRKLSIHRHRKDVLISKLRQIQDLKS